MLKLYGRFFSINLKSQMQYKTSFFLMFFGQFIIAFSSFLGMYFLFSRFNTVEGFTMREVLLCFSAVNMAFTIAETFVRGFDVFSVMISNGDFDRILLRPRNVIFLVLASKMEFSRLGKLLQGLLIVAVAVPAVEWTWDKAVTYLLMVVSGAFIFSCLFIIGASVCFFTTESLEILNIFTDGTKQFGQYPISIYGEGILKFLTYVLPVALFQYYPFLYLLGRETSAFYMLCPLLTVLFFIPTYILWRIGLRHYKSTGS